MVDGLLLDLSIFFEVRFVPDETQSNFVMRVGLYLSEPMFQSFERSFIAKIEYEESHNGSPIIGSRDGSERLLSCGIPDLQFDFSIIDVNIFRSKLDPQRGLMLVLEPSFQKSQQEAAFPYT